MALLRVRVVFLLLVLAMAIVAESYSSVSSFGGGADWGISHLSSNNGDGGLSALHGSCNGRVGECMIDSDEEEMMDSETNRRILAGQKKYISYAALKKNSIPCNRRGNSYYNNCVRRAKANPYKRGCSKITNCQRYTNI